MNNKNFDDFFITQLNDAQQQAVAHTAGPLLVIAGAGSGKTRVITARISYLVIKEHIDPRSIIALTFTNKAAQEMKERVNHFVAGVYNGFVGTFHSYCLQLLKRYSNFLPFASFTIMDADDQDHLLSHIIKRAGLEKRLSSKNLGYQISSYKNNLHHQESDYLTDKNFLQLYTLYEQEKKKSHCFDFDDLLLEVVRLLKEYPDLKEHHLKNVRHILVDEYQDTNVTQHELLKQMSKHNDQLVIDSLCAVGDEDQSIYSWRGATIANMINFQQDFPGTQLIKIEQNYRSVQPILQTANIVIANNQQRHPKKLWSEKKAHDRIRIIQCMSGYQEGEALAQAIKRLSLEKKHATVAVLYRAHYQSRSLEEALIRHSISYTIIGGIAFYERKEIKDLLAYLRLIINPFDRVSFARVVNCPARGLGEKFQEDFFDIWDTQPFYNFLDCCTHMIERDLVSGIKQKSVSAFAALFQSVDKSEKPSIVLDTIITRIQYIQHLQNNFDKEDAETKIDNVRELIRAIKHFEQHGLLTVEQFLHEVALIQEKKALSEQSNYNVTLMTLHAAKGLEFDMVILSGLEEGIFPSTRSTYEPHGLEEERRLFYVGITRAKEYLLITHTRYRYTFKSMNDQMPSRFLQELPAALVTTSQTNNWHDSDFIKFFAQWFGATIATEQRTVYTFGPSATTPARGEHSKNQMVNSNVSAIWKKNQSVHHARFGVGTITNIDAQQGTTFLTITFKCGSKKINAAFVTTV